MTDTSGIEGENILLDFLYSHGGQYLGFYFPSFQATWAILSSVYYKYDLRPGCLMQSIDRS